MKRFLFLAFAAAASIGVHADYNRLVFNTLDGGAQSVGLEGLNITFAGGEMTALSDGESVKIAVPSLKSMEFGQGQSGIDAVTSDKGASGAVSVYSIDGLLQGTFDSAASAAEALPGGAYIIKAENGVASKIIIRR